MKGKYLNNKWISLTMNVWVEEKNEWIGFKWFDTYDDIF